MSSQRAAREETAARRRLNRVALLLALAVTARGSLHAQPVQRLATPAQGLADEQIIVSLRANGVERGEFAVLRRADGDWWILASDLDRLQLHAGEAARRQAGGEAWISLAALGASHVVFQEADVALVLDFPVAALHGTTIDLSTRPAVVPLTAPGRSLILSYRLAGRRTSQGHTVTLDNDINVRLGALLLRQETRLDTSTPKRLVRGSTQAIWDDARHAVRVVAGDVVSTGGAFGSTITAAGVMVSKLYALTPDVIRQPTVSLRTATTLPAEVEVSVDGSPVYRTNVMPGPVALDNLSLTGGTRNVRVTVTDIAGRREVIEQPFLFTDSVLAPGLHEYSYFAGKRSELGPSNEWRYREAAWQGYHRYGVNEHLTVAAGGEGSADFTNAGAGITLRSDRLGLASLDVLGSHDGVRSHLARGWSARYTYPAPDGSFILAHRRFEEGFRTFTTSALQPFLRRETRVGVTRRVWASTVGLDFVRSEDANEKRDLATVRFATNFTPRLTLTGEYQATRVNGRRERAAFLFVRADLDQQHWVSTNASATSSLRTLDVETGRQVDQGEGFGYRAGVNTTWAGGGASSYAFGAGNWNLRPAAISFFGTSPLRGGGGSFSEAAVSGAVVGVDGYWGVTRRVSDSFVLARLGVPQRGVEISVNNQVQGRTDESGQLVIPQVGAFGRQDVTLNDKQLGMQYIVRDTRRTIAPPYRSGTVVDFGGHKVNAVAGMSWLVRQGRRLPVTARAWKMAGPGGGSVQVETGSAGDFYLEDAPPGNYRGELEWDGKLYSCRMSVPVFEDAVLELKEGIVCGE